MLGKDRTKKLNFNNINNYINPNPKNILMKKPSTQKDTKKTSKKIINNFEKITGSGDINIAGNNPVVVYKKSNNHKKVSKSPNPLKSKYTINKTKFEYVSDGGMAQKIQKYNSNNNLNQNNNINNKNLYYYNNYVSEKGKNLPINKNKKNNIEKNKINNNNSNTIKTKKQILSKTVREFNKRPNILNNKDNANKDINNKSKNSFDEKKIKHKIGSQNMIKNSKLYNKASKEDSKNQEEQKLIRMKQLVENGVVNEIKKLENKIKIQKKDIKIERKKEVLENQGLPMNYLYEENEEERKTESNHSLDKYNEVNNININNINNLNRQFMSKSTRGFYPRINNYIFPEEKNINDENVNQIKEKKKPSVNQFEFINKINNEKKKLNPNEFNPNNINIYHSSNMLQKRKVKSVNMELNDSFRHKNIKRTKNPEINNIKKNLKLKPKSFKGEINRKNLDDLIDEFPYSHRKNHRTSEELKDFLKEKKLKLKKEEQNTLLQKHKKLFVLYKNLCNLNMKDFSKQTPSVSEDHFLVITPPSTKSPTSRSRPNPNKNNLNLNLIKNKSNNISNESSNNLRKKKEINQYYIGSDSTIKNNNSTLIDANEYYLNVLESQQLFVNSGLNKIENYLDTSEDNDKDSKDLNVSKEQIKKIITKEKNSNEKKNKNNLVLNTNEFDELKNKFEKTLKRAEKIFSKRVKEDKINNDKDKSKEKKDINIKDKKDINIKVKNELNIQEKKDINNNIKENNNNINNKKDKEGNNKNRNTKSPEINIESSNEVQQPKLIINDVDISENNTKEKNLPSLSHTFHTNSNPNKKLDIEIEPRAVFNLVEIIKFIIQRKVFLLLYETYIKRAIRQQYSIACAFFVAVCKQYAFRKLEEYCNYITYKYAFRQLFKPFIRRGFKKMRKNYFLKRKIEFFSSCLNKIYKKKTFASIKNYAKIKFFVKVLINKLLKTNFTEFIKKAKIYQKNNDKKKENKINIKKVEIKNNFEDIELEDDDKIDINYENYIKRRNNNDVKMNSYVYESFGSDSKSLSVEPNSENNDKLHQLKMMLLIKNNIYNDDDSNNANLDSLSNSLNNSAHKITSKKNKKKKDAKLDISSDDDEINQIKSKELKNNKKIKDLKEKNNEEEKISLDISADKDKNNDIEWSYDIKKEEKKKENKNKEELDKLKKEKLFDDDYNDFEKEIDDINNKCEKKEEKKEVIEDNKIVEKEKNDNIKQPIDKSSNLKIDEGTETEKQEENKEEKIVVDKIIPELNVDKENPPSLDKEKLIEKNKIIIDNIIDDNKNIIDDKNEKKKIEILKQNLTENKNEKEEEKEKEDKEEIKNKIKEEENKRELLSKKLIQIKDIDTLVNSLTEEIMLKLINTEIKTPKKKLIPLKKFKYDKFEKVSNVLNSSFGSAGNSHDHLSKEFGLGGLSNQLSLADELLSLNDSLMSNYSSNSVFNKTIKDKKKEKTTNLYFKEIAPRLIKLIRKEIISKYDLIYENISTPMKNNSEKLMISLALQDADLLRDNYKNTNKLISISKILDKQKILKTFEPINKKIRNNDNVTSDNFYDKMLNDCIIETAIEIINKERLYGKNGEPLEWSSRMHELSFKYKKNEPKKLADFVCNKLIFYIKRKVGLINDNYDDMSMDQINMEKDKRLTGIIKRDLDENEYQWNNLEMEETQLKVDNTEQIMEQLYNEVIEILEHIQYSRIKPELYQNKSIYACDEIPKLDFQVTITEDGILGEGNDINIDKINI